MHPSNRGFYVICTLPMCWWWRGIPNRRQVTRRRYTRRRIPLRLTHHILLSVLLTPKLQIARIPNLINIRSALSIHVECNRRVAVYRVVCGYLERSVLLLPDTWEEELVRRWVGSVAGYTDSRRVPLYKVCVGGVDGIVDVCEVCNCDGVREPCAAVDVGCVRGGYQSQGKSEDLHNS